MSDAQRARLLVELGAIRETIAALSYDEDDETEVGVLSRLRVPARELAIEGLRLAVPVREMAERLNVSEAQFAALTR